MQFQWVDLVFLGIIGFSSMMGLFRGFIKEALALGIWFGAVWAGYNYSGSATPYIQPYIHNPTAVSVLGFGAVVVGVLIVGGIANFVLGLFLKGSGLGPVDKILGGIFGFSKGVFMISLIFAILSMTSLPYQQYVGTSSIYNQMLPVINWLHGYLPGLINQAKQLADNNTSFKLIDITPDV
jgi:membrane protein required for colicin V production